MRLIKNIINKYANNKVLNLLPEEDILVTLKDFNVTREDIEIKMNGLVVLNKNDIVISQNGEIQFKPDKKPVNIEIYQYSKDVYKILKDEMPNKIIARVVVKMDTDNLVLNMYNYVSVKNTYDTAKACNIEIKTDAELIDYATKQMCPRKRFVQLERRLGERAFSGSKVTKYKLKVMYCFDLDYISKIENTDRLSN